MIVLYKCKIHGDCYEQDVNKSHLRSDGTVKYRCKRCFKIVRDRNYSKHRVAMLAKRAKYRERFPDKIRRIRRESAKRCPLSDHAKLKDRERNRKLERWHYANITERYAKKALVKGTNLSHYDLPKELIACMQGILRLKREISNKRKEIKNGRNKEHS